MLFKKIIIVLFLYASTNVFAQSDSTLKQNDVFFEIGGLGGFYSFNFQRNIFLNKNWGINWGVGFSPQGTYGVTEGGYMPEIPIRVKAFYQINNKNLIDFGIGVVPYNGNGLYLYSNDDYNLTAHVILGYRHSLKNNKYWGINFTPFIYDTYEFVLLPWGSINFGYNFNKVGKYKNSDKENDKTFKRNVAGIFGPLVPKIRIQYERSCHEKYSIGINLTSYLFHHEYAGSRADFFGRRYFKNPDKMEGIFLQAKVGLGYQYSGLNIKYAEVPTFGFSIGGGIAGGYKFFIGNHLTLESILGVHYYTPPFVKGTSQSQLQAEKDWWYSMTGFPLDLQFKIGWQY